jgi:iron(III) transport system permease protein
MPTLRAGLAESSLKPAGIRVRLGPFFPIYLGVWGFLGAFLVVPIGRILAETALALAEGDAPLAVGFGEYLARVTFNSILVAGLAAFASVAFGIPLAFFTTKTLTPGRGIFRVLLALPLITPPFISAFATILLLGRTGVITQLLGRLGLPELNIYGPVGLTLTHVLHFIPLAYLTIAAGLQVVPAAVEEAAASLGSRTVRTLVRVVLPYVWPHILMAAALVFLASFGDVGAPLLLAGNFRVLPLETYTAFNSFQVDPRISLILASWSIILAFMVLLAVRGLMVRTELQHTFTTRIFVYRGRAVRWVGFIFCLGVTALLFLPYVAIVISAFGTVWATGLLPAAFTLRNYQYIFSNLQDIRNSLVLSAIATPLCVWLAVSLGKLFRDYGPKVAWLDYVVLLPFVIPGVVIGIGLVKTYPGLQPLGLPVLLPVAYAVRRLPYAVRVMTAGYSRIDRALEEASVSLGASGWRTFWQVTWPQLLPAVAATGVVAFIRIITELGSTLIILPPGWRTATVAVFYYAAEGFIGRASAMAVVLILVVAAGSALANLATGSGPKGDDRSSP